MKYINVRVILLIVFAALSRTVFGQDIISDNGHKYMSNEIIVKFKTVDQVLKKSTSSFAVQNSSIGVRDVEAVYKNSDDSDLNRTYVVKYTSPYDPVYLSKTVGKQKNILWAEPHYVDEIAFVPDDPSYNTFQDNLKTIKAAQAWDITKGSPEIVIAIIDTGVDWFHPDLQGNVWTKPGTTDIHGWDFGSNDSDPSVDGNSHGTHVAGIAAAVTDNGIGIASIGFNTKFMAIKVTTGSSGSFAFPFEAIQYAVDNGADILNFSWKGDSYSRAEQELMDYAVSKGVVIVAAVGNDDSDFPTYPASYHGVLSVAATNNGDARYISGSGSSNYGETVDVASPGAAIYSTLGENGYGTLSGTSMATPLVSGLAALVKSVFPNYSPLQIEEQIRVNTDSIDTINSGFEMLLGSGRINASKAVSNLSSISVRAEEINIIDKTNGDGIFNPGESFDIDVMFRNYLWPVAGLKVSLTTADNNVIITNDKFNAGSLETLDSISNSGNRFSVDINSNNVPQNHKLKLLLNYTAQNYSDYQWIIVNLNPSFATQSGNDIALTINGTGSLGFENYSDPPSDGDGLKFKNGENLIYEGAFMYGVSGSSVMDAAHISDSKSKDFKNIVQFTLNNGGIADQQGRTVFNDTGAGVNKLGLETELNSFSFADVPNDEFIILKYTLKNNSENSYNNLYVGLFLDLDIYEGDFDGDIADYDIANNFGYAYDEDANPDSTYVGLALVSSNNYGFYAMDGDTSGGRISVIGNFTDDEKWRIISSGVDMQSAGPGDISIAVSGGPFVLPVNNEIDVAFAIGAAYNLNDLQKVMIQSRTQYNDIFVGIKQIDNIPSDFSLSQNYPNPFNPSTTIKFSIPESGKYRLDIYNILGEKVATLLDKNISAGNYTLKFDSSSGKNRFTSGVYLYRLIGHNFSKSKKMILLK